MYLDYLMSPNSDFQFRIMRFLKLAYISHNRSLTFLCQMLSPTNIHALRKID